MDSLFGKKKTPQEILRENKRMLDKAIRELDREGQQIDSQEKKLKAEIKKAAKEDQMEAVRIMAKSIVRNRAAVTKLLNLKAQLQAVSLRITALKSTNTMAQAMRGATKAMKSMNKQLNLPALQKIMREFEMQNEKMDMTQEMMGDAIDDAFEGEGEQEETDMLVDQVLVEIGITTQDQLVSAPTSQHAPAVAQEAGPQPVAADGGAGLDDDLQARLDKLRQQ